MTVQQVVLQYDEGGDKCAVHRGKAKRHTVSRDVHHIKRYHAMQVKLDPRCAGLVKSGVRIERVAGNPMILEDSRWSSNFVTAP